MERSVAWHEIAFNPENPSFRALNALYRETCIGPSGLLVAGFMFMNQSQQNLWNPNKQALAVLFVGVALVILRLLFPVYACHLPSAAYATYTERLCPYGQTVSLAPSVPTYQSKALGEISFYKADPFYTYTQGIILLILFSILYIAAQRNSSQNHAKTSVFGISEDEDREIPVKIVAPTTQQTKHEGSGPTHSGILTRIETYLQKQKGKNQIYVENHTLKWTFFSMIGLLVFTVALKMGGVVDWNKQVFYFAVATFFIGGNFGRVLGESGVSREKRLKAGTLATVIFIVSILVLTI